MALAVGMNKMVAIREYIIKEKIGIGSYGVVFKVMNKIDKKIYVLKQISLFGLNKSQITEVKNEAKFLSQLNSPWVVKYCDSFEENSNLDIVMEYCDGGDLSNFLSMKMKSSKLLNEDVIWKIFIQISLGLAYIHRKKILHRDLKTLNIFLTKDLEVKIGDLGVAKSLLQQSFAKTFVGTPYYLSPEICEEKPYNEKSDVWALGCILYEISTYKHPFNATNQAALIIKILKGKYDPISSKYSSELRKMIDVMLERSDFSRPSMDDVIKMPIFMSKAKSVGMSEYVINFYNEINYSVDECVYLTEKKKGGYESPIVVSPNQINNNNSNHKQQAHVVKIEFPNNPANFNGNINLINEKVIKMEEKKLIQMNLPNNFKKELVKKKEKKENSAKQNLMVKQIVLGSAGNGNIGNGGIVQIPINAVNKIVLPSNAINNQNVKKPIKLIKKDKDDSESMSEINKKIEDVARKMDEFDKRYNLINKKHDKLVAYNEQKRPTTSNCGKVVPSSNERKRPSWSEGDYKEEICGDVNKKSNNVNEKPSKQDNSVTNTNPNTDSGSGIIKKEKGKVSNETDEFSKLINGNLRCTEFFDELKNVPMEKIIGIQNSKQLNIQNFVKELDKKTQSSSRITISDFMTGEKDNYKSRMHPIMDSVVNNFKEMMAQSKMPTSEVNVDNTRAENIQNCKNECKKIKNENISNPNTATVIVHKIDDTAEPVPILFNSGEANIDFQVVEDNNDSIASDKPVQDESSIEDDVDYTNANSGPDKSNKETTNEGEDGVRSDEEGVEGVEQVCVIKDKDFGMKKGNNKMIEESIPVQVKIELVELKGKFVKKIEYYQNECKKTAGEKEYNQIFAYYHEIEGNSADIDEIGQKIEAYVTTAIPAKCAVFIQSFYNLIYYDIQLGNVLKELEGRKCN